MRELIKLNGKECYIDGFLLQKLENIEKIIKKNWDCVFLIDGMERSGKSTLGLTCAWYLAKGKLTYNNIASDADDAVMKCEKLPDRSILVIDEGSLVFSSKETMSAEQKKLIKIMNVIGQKNMIFIIILPSFFDLNKFIAVSRSRFLLHIYPGKTLSRGKFCYFGEQKKKILYEFGKKHFNSYKFPRANFVGQFWDFFPLENLEEYKKIKQKSLFDAFHKKDLKVKDIKKDLFLEIIKRNDKEPKIISDKLLKKVLGLSNGTFYRYKLAISSNSNP